jgi:FkbM family methyltransferase
LLNGVNPAVRQASRKLSWGARQVGVVRTATGLAHLGVLAIRRPDQARVRTARNQLTITFRYPSQLMPMLVAFRDLIEPELGVLPVALGPGRIAIDVGASIGTWTMSAARTGCTVHSCEPDLLNLEMLEANLRANSLLNQVTTYPVALGEHEGRGHLLLTPRRYRNQVGAPTGATGNEIPVTTLDRFVDDLKINEVDVLKVNTAGRESDVIQGALGLFRAGRIRLALVLDGLEVRPVLDELRACSYDIGVYDGNQRIFVSVPRSSDLEAARPSPINRYILVRRDDVNVNL